MGCGWTNDEDIGDEKIKLRLFCEFDCCISMSVQTVVLMGSEQSGK